MSSFLPAHTPEKLLGRNDSKNAAATCAGITSSGRACRRALASPKSSRRASAVNGVVNVAAVGDDGGMGSAYCWQHKEQAVPVGSKKMGSGLRRSADMGRVREKSSVDTLVQRLGIESLPGEAKASRRQSEQQSKARVPKRTEVRDYAMRPEHQPAYHEKWSNFAEQEPVRRRSQPKKQSFWLSLCCMTGSHEEDYVEIVRHRRRPDSEKPMTVPANTVAFPPRIPSNKPAPTSRPASASAPARRPVPSLPARPTTLPHRPLSNPQPNHLLSLIPQHLSPQTTSALLAELIKPISPADEEGYIYIFWLTPQSKTAPDEGTAKSLLTTPTNGRGRRVSDVMTEYSFDGDSNDRSSGGVSAKGATKKTIMLKIGRANNVTRRMHEWQRQCGYALNLVRWYPYLPSASASPTDRRDSNTLVKKVQCVKRVERLIHLELQGQQVLRRCAACGKEHREWFEVEASQDGVKAVDGVVRRWVGWAEGLGRG